MKKSVAQSMGVCAACMDRKHGRCNPKKYKCLCSWYDPKMDVRASETVKR